MLHEGGQVQIKYFILFYFILGTIELFFFSDYISRSIQWSISAAPRPDVGRLAPGTRSPMVVDEVPGASRPTSGRGHVRSGANTQGVTMVQTWYCRGERGRGRGREGEGEVLRYTVNLYANQPSIKIHILLHTFLDV